MKYLILIVLAATTCNSSCGQQSLRLAQGTWKEDVDGFQSFVVVEGNYWYSIVLIEGQIDVSRDWIGFYDDFKADSLHAHDLIDSGKYLVFLRFRHSIKDYKGNLPRRYFKFYSYDIGERYFIYYGANPVNLTRIEKLPEKIQESFNHKKAELLLLKFVEVETK